MDPHFAAEGVDLFGSGVLILLAPAILVGVFVALLVLPGF